MFLKWTPDRKEIAVPMISRLLYFQYPKFCMLSDLAGIVELDR